MVRSRTPLKPPTNGSGLTIARVSGAGGHTTAEEKETVMAYAYEFRCPWEGCTATIGIEGPWWEYVKIQGPDIRCPCCGRPCDFDEVWDEKAEEDMPVLEQGLYYDR